jgi:haloalkane dehalogenase
VTPGSLLSINRNLPGTAAHERRPQAPLDRIALMIRNPFLVTTVFVMILCAPQPGAAKDDGATDAPDLAEYGFEPRVLKSPVGRMTVYEAGQGQPLLLLHGIGAGASSFLWYRIAPALTAEYRVIAPDFVGWGRSDRLERPVGFDDYVAQVGFLGEWIGEPVHVVVQSLASGFAIEAMKREGLEVERLILNGPSGGKDFGGDAFPPGATESFKRLVAAPDGGKAFYEQSFLASGVIRDWYENTGFSEPGAVPSELVAASEYGARRPGSHFSALPFLSGTLRYDIAPLLREVDVPTLMIWGDKEIQIEAGTRHRLEQVNPEIEVARIRDARSVFEIEYPAETLELIRGFFSAGGEPG